VHDAKEIMFDELQETPLEPLTANQQSLFSH